jgi:hypothetical protein
METNPVRQEKKKLMRELGVSGKHLQARRKIAEKKAQPK